MRSSDDEGSCPRTLVTDAAGSIDAPGSIDGEASIADSDPDDPVASPWGSIEASHDDLGERPVARACTTSSAGQAQRFVARELLGVGAMGAVTRVRDRRLLRDVAWKEGDARLLREARILAQLEHPGIVPVHDLGFSERGTCHFAMRVIRGRSLGEALRDHEGTAGLTHLRSLARAAEAVAYAHHRGVVHRDLKPANVMVGDFGEIQVVDWGLARVLDDGAEPIDAEVRLALASTGEGRVSTPGFMSPEQEAGLPADRRSDVFALGRMLERVVRGEPVSRLAPELVAIARRATEVDPALRYPDAAAFGADLQAFLEGGRVAAHSYRPRELLFRFARAYRVPLVIAGIGLALALVLVALYVVDVGHQRLLAEEAEGSTRRALVRSDALLGFSLTGEARRNSEAGARAESEVLAAHALVIGENPDARAMIAKTFGAPRPELVSRVASPCHTAFPDPADGRLLCVEPDGLRLYRWVGGALEHRWSHDMPVRAAMIMEGGTAVSSESEVILFGDDGAELLRRRHANNLTRKVTSRGDQVTFETARVSTFVALHPEVTIAPYTPCEDTLHSSIALAPRSPAGTFDAGRIFADGRVLAVICKDGKLRVSTSDEAREAATPFVAPEREAIRLVALGAGRFALGTIKGEVAVIGSDGSVLASQRVTSGMVRVLEPSPDGRWLAVGGEGGAIDLLGLPELTRVAALPRRADNPRWDLTRPGELVTTGRWIERWRMSEATQERPLGGAHALVLDDGVVDLDADPTSPARIAVAYGASVGLVGHQGVERFGAPWVTAKGVAFSEGELLAGGVVGMLAFQRDRLVPHSAWRRIAVRRLAALADGTFVLGSYTSVLRVFSAGAIGLGGEVREEGVVFADGGVTGDDVVVVEKRGSLDLGVSPDRLWVASLREGDKMILLLRAGRPGFDEVVSDATAEAVAVSDGGEVIYAAGRGLVKAWGPDARLLFVYDGLGLDLYEVDASGDGRWLAAGAREGDVFVWRVGEARPRAHFHDHEERVPALAFGRDSRWLASGSWDRVLRVRDLESLEVPAGELVRQLERAYALTLGEALGDASLIR